MASMNVPGASCCRVISDTTPVPNGSLAVHRGNRPGRWPPAPALLPSGRAHPPPRRSCRCPTRSPPARLVFVGGFRHPRIWATSRRSCGSNSRDQMSAYSRCVASKRLSRRCAGASSRVGGTPSAHRDHESTSVRHFLTRNPADDAPIPNARTRNTGTVRLEC